MDFKFGKTVKRIESRLTQENIDAIGCKYNVVLLKKGKSVEVYKLGNLLDVIDVSGVGIVEFDNLVENISKGV